MIRERERERWGHVGVAGICNRSEGADFLYG